MLKNYITDTDLQKYYPKISSYLWSGSSNYTTQITEAFNLVVDDMIARGLDYVKLGTQIDLLRSQSSTDYQHKLTYETFTANDFKTHLLGFRGFRRLVVDNLANSVTGSNAKVVLQGSNDIGISDTTEPSNWVDITTISLTSSTGVSSSVFQNEYDYYRIGIYDAQNSYTTTDNVTAFTEATAFTSGSVRLSVSLVETYIDRWIILKTFEMLFRDFSKEANDIWDKRSEEASRQYKQSIDAFKFTYDTNANNLVDRADREQDAQSRLYR